MQNKFDKDRMNFDWENSYGAEPDLAEIANLDKDTIEKIDVFLMNHMTHNWQKTALIIVKTLGDIKKEMPDCKVTDLFCSMRLRKLVEENKLQSQGDLFRMRFSEVRLPNP